jgi:hypothetical protein
LLDLNPGLLDLPDLNPKPSYLVSGYDRRFLIRT